MFLLPGNAVNRSAPLNRGLVSWWMHLPNRLAGGGNTFRDLMGRNHGTLTNGPTWRGASRPGGAGSLSLASASSQYVAVGSSTAFNIAANDFCISAWISPSDVATYQIIVGRDGDLTHRDVALGFGNTSGKLLYFTDRNNDATGVLLESSAVLTTGWQHVAVTRIGSTLTLWRNGVSVGTTTDNKTGSITTATSIGRREFSGFPNYLNCPVDDVRYHVGASPSVASIYQASRRGYQNELNWLRRNYGPPSTATGNRRRRIICGAQA